MNEIIQNFRSAPKPAGIPSNQPCWWWIGLVALLAWLPPAGAAQQSPLNRLLQDSQTKAYQAPSPDELKQVEYLFRQAFTGAARPAQRAAWAALGFTVERVTEKQQVFTVIREQPNQRQGRGLYIFALAAAGAPILQAPHALDDKHTGAIAIALLAEGGFMAGAWSTAPRRYENEDDEVVKDSDMAHQPDSYFIAFSRAAAAAQPASAILQLHGFSNAKRKTDIGRRANVIVSAGQHQPTPAAEQVAGCLRNLMNYALLYPTEVKELGALTNQIGQALRTLERSSFVHIEMNQPLRDQVNADPSVRQRVGACLLKAHP